MDHIICPGASKSGSTWLYGLLKQHPAINASKVKETKFFTYEAHKGLEAYLDHFEDPTQANRYYCDISPIYMIDPTVPEKIFHRLGPDVRLIFLVREPVDRLYSQYQMDRRFGYEKEDLLTAVNRSEDKRQSLSRTNFKHPYGNDYIGESRYDLALKRYLEYFDRKQIHVIVFESLISEPQREMSRLFDFLKVEDISRQIDYRANKGGAKVYTRNRFLIKYYVRYFSRIKWIKRAVNISSVRDLMRKVVGMKYQKNPPLKEKDRRILKERFIETTTYIESWIGRDMTEWQ